MNCSNKNPGKKHILAIKKPQNDSTKKIQETRNETRQDYSSKLLKF